MGRKFVVAVGLSGAGKTWYCARLGVPMLSFDGLHNYPEERTDYGEIGRFLAAHGSAPVVAMDGFIIPLDPDAARLAACTDRDIDIVHVRRDLRAVRDGWRHGAAPSVQDLAERDEFLADRLKGCEGVATVRAWWNGAGGQA